MAYYKTSTIARFHRRRSRRRRRAAENAHREQFRSILGKVSQSVDPDGDESPYGPAHSPKDAFDRVVWRHKARIVASVTRGVVRELNRYMRAAHAKHGV